MNLAAIQAEQERNMLRAFREAIQGIRDSVTLNEVTRALETGNIDAAVRLLQIEPAAFQGLEEAAREAYRTGGMTGAEQIGQIPTSDGRIVARFNVRSPRAERWLLAESSRLVVEISEQQRAMARAVLTERMAQGANPRAAALDIVGRVDSRTRRRTGGFIGLTDRQTSWVQNARSELNQLNPEYFNRELRDRRFDAAVARAIRDGEPLPQRTIDNAITNMQARAQRYRGEVIARTESINALRAGQFESIQQALETEGVGQAEAVKVWDSSGDARTREEHAAADGQSVPVSQPFVVGGEALMYPGDPAGSAANTIQCRCTMRTEINFGAIAKRLEGFG